MRCDTEALTRAPRFARRFQGAYRYQPIERHGLSPDQIEKAEACAGLNRVIVHHEFISAYGEPDDDTRSPRWVA